MSPAFYKHMNKVLSNIVDRLINVANTGKPKEERPYDPSKDYVPPLRAKTVQNITITTGGSLQEAICWGIKIKKEGVLEFTGTKYRYYGYESEELTAGQKTLEIPENGPFQLHYNYLSTPAGSIFTLYGCGTFIKFVTPPQGGDGS